MVKVIFLTFVAIFLAASPAFRAQTTAEDPEKNKAPFPEISTSDRVSQDQRNRGPRPMRGMPQPGQFDLSAFPALTAEQMAAIMETSTQGRFIPPVEYIRKYYSYATGFNSGLVRLFADKGCGTGKTVNLAEIERCADVPQKNGGGSYYGFRAQNLYGLKDKGWILRYANDKFYVGNELVQGVIADIGTVNIDSVDERHIAVDLLEGYEPEKEAAEVRERFTALAAGIKHDGNVFSNVLPVKIGSTYLLRAVIYRYAEKGAYLPDRGFDQYVVLQVAGRETDGSVIIAWKELKREYPRRKLELE